MSNRDNQILLAILEAIDKIFSYVQNIKNIKEFGINNQVLDASLMNFVVIGELANKLSNEFRNEITTIDWSAIKGFRNIIAHDYFGVNTEEVWQIIHNELPKLKKEIQNIVDLNGNIQRPMF